MVEDWTRDYGIKPHKGYYVIADWLLEDDGLLRENETSHGKMSDGRQVVSARTVTARINVAKGRLRTLN